MADDDTITHAKFLGRESHLAVELLTSPNNGTGEPYLWIGDSADGCYLDSLSGADLWRLRREIDKALDRR